MISRAVQSALEASEKSELHKCPREDSFPEMYSALGDPEEQGRIRKRSSDKAHCVYLQADCNACLVMPEIDGVDPKYHGQPCWNNPYTKPEADELMRQERMLEEANVLLDACRLGLIESLAHLQAGEFIALRWVLRYEMIEKLKMQMTANLAGLGGSELM